MRTKTKTKYNKFPLYCYTFNIKKNTVIVDLREMLYTDEFDKNCTLDVFVNKMLHFSHSKNEFYIYTLDRDDKLATDIFYNNIKDYLPKIFHFYS